MPNDAEGKEKRNWTWSFITLCIFAFYIAAVIWATWFPPTPGTVLAKIIKDFQGNLIAEFVANLVFLTLAIQLDRKTTIKIDRIKDLVEKSEEVLKKREDQLEREQKIAQFEQFMKDEAYHNVRFPDLTSQSLSIIPNGMTGYVENAALAKSKTKLENFKCIRPLEIAVIEGMPLQNNLQESLEKNIKESTHCEVKIQFLEMGQFMEAFSKRSFDLYVAGLDTNSTDSLGFYRQFVSGSSENYLRYNDKELNKVYENLYALLPNKRTQSDYQNLQEIFYKTGFGIAIGRPQFKFLYSQKVKTVHMNPLGMHLNRWWKIGRI